MPTLISVLLSTMVDKKKPKDVLLSLGLFIYAPERLVFALYGALPPWGYIPITPPLWTPYIANTGLLGGVYDSILQWDIR